MILPSADSEEDPTTQMTFPTRRRDVDATHPVETDEQLEQAAASKSSPATATNSVLVKKRLSTWNLVTLSISMAGAQVAWTVELGYGTPFLLGLGLSEQLTSLVWLAGPISGLIAQPVIGAISDSSSSKYRRRYWVVLSTLVLVASTLVLAYCKDLAAAFVDFFQVGAGDWDDKRNIRVQSTAIGLAVTSFYLLDFALNALQASLRNLLLDITPAAQLNAGNAWHSRMTNAGNIIGYGFGFIPLAQLPILKLIGGSQFRKFCVVCIVILSVTVWITCWCHEEEERPKDSKKENKLREVFDNIRSAIVTLPKPIRRVCYVQLFAFLGWFPFLFYATTYIGQVMAYELGKEPDADTATRMGEFAMLLYSLVGVIAGSILPFLASRDRRLIRQKEDVSPDAEINRIRNTVREWRAEAARKGKPVRLPMVPFLLRNIWTGSLLLYSILTFSTFFISTVAQATAFISLVGISWAVAMWAPFAIIMELLKEAQTPAEPPQRDIVSRHHYRTRSGPGGYQGYSRVRGEREPLLRRRSQDDHDVPTGEGETSSKNIAGGTILGVHNLAIVMPQFVVSLVTSIIFRVVDGDQESNPTNHDAYYGKNGVAWVLRFGGLCTLLAALIARMVPPTPTEKAMRRRLSEMRDIQEADV